MTSFTCRSCGEKKWHKTIKVYGPTDEICYECSTGQTTIPIDVPDIMQCTFCKRTYKQKPIRCSHCKRTKFTAVRPGGRNLAHNLSLKQGNRCAVCLGLYPGNIDHNHETGLIRGMLCTNCNLALGLLKDSSANCHRAAEYLLNPPVKESIKYRK